MVGRDNRHPGLTGAWVAHVPESVRLPTRALVISGLRTCARGLVSIGLFSLALNFLLLAVPLYTLSIYDRVLTSRSGDTLIMLSVLAVAALVIVGVIESVRQLMAARLGARLETVLGGPLLDTALRSEDPALGDVQPLRDLSTVRHAISSPLVGAIFDLPVVPLYLGLLFLVHWQLGWLALAFTVIIAIVAYANERLTAAPLAETSRQASIALQKAQAHARNSEVIRAMGMNPATLASWGENNARSLAAADRAALQNAVFNGAGQVLRLVLQIGIIGYGAYLVLLDASVSAGILFAAALVSARALAPINQIIAGWRTLASVAEAWGRIARAVSFMPTGQPPMELPAPDATIAVEKLVYRANDNSEPILKGISFAIEAGEIVGLVGPSGAGKSTLARLIVGAMRPTAGIVRIGGSDRAHWLPEDLGPYIGYVPQDVELFPASVAQNIARMSPEPDSGKVVAAARLANCHDLIQRLPKGYNTLLGTNGYGLSGGERQRIALARAFYGEPRIVVLDEPDASLDTRGEEALFGALQQARAAGITCVVITQRMAVVPALTKIMFMRGGRIEAFGPRDEILQKQLRAAAPQGAPAQPQIPASYTGRFFG